MIALSFQIAEENKAFLILALGLEYDIFIKNLLSRHLISTKAIQNFFDIGLPFSPIKIKVILNLSPFDRRILIETQKCGVAVGYCVSAVTRGCFSMQPSLQLFCSLVIVYIVCFSRRVPTFSQRFFLSGQNAIFFLS